MRDCYPVEVLSNEHRIIERVLDAVEARLETLDAANFPTKFFEQALDFITNFADGCHHYKEEECLFPTIQERGIRREGGPVGVMLYEHDQGRHYVAGIRANLEAASAGSEEAVEAVRENAEAYIHLLRQHIFKEDNILFPMACNVLAPADVTALRAKYQGAEPGSPVHEKYEALAAEIAGAAVASR